MFVMKHMKNVRKHAVLGVATELTEGPTVENLRETLRLQHAFPPFPPRLTTPRAHPDAVSPWPRVSRDARAEFRLIPKV
jgi:hypothetical protein